jgi:hypothetical protein
MQATYKNKNRGYQQLRVWQDATDYYVLTCRTFKRFQFELRRVGSLGESVSGLYAYRQAEQLNESDFNSLNDLFYKLENGLLKLVESLERKQESGDWIDSLIVKESNIIYG